MVPSPTVARRALCIGIKYDKNNKAEMDQVTGAHEDAKAMADFLKKKGFEVNLLLDDKNGPPPTKENIRLAIQKLTADANPGDCLFLSWAGHGAQIDNDKGTEKDNLDEIFLTYGAEIDQAYPNWTDRNHWKADTIIVDDEMHVWLVKSLPPGSKLTIVLDSCSSGTATDLNHILSCKRKTSQDTMVVDSPIESPILCGEIITGTKHCNSLVIERDDWSSNQSSDSSEPLNGPSVYCWSACPDHEQSYGNSEGGIFSKAWLTCFSASYDGGLTVKKAIAVLHHLMNDSVKKINASGIKNPLKEQIPQVSSLRRSSMNELLEHFL